jgi:hypothetical protein
MHHVHELNVGFDILAETAPGFLHGLDEVLVIGHEHGQLPVVLEEVVYGNGVHTFEDILTGAFLHSLCRDRALLLGIQQAPGLLDHVSFAFAHFVIAQGVAKFAERNITIPIHIVVLVQSLEVDNLGEKPEKQLRI